MSSVPTSENNHSDAPTDRAKRARVIQNTRNGTGSNVSNQASEDGKLTENVQTNKSPSDIAKGVASEFIAKLHPGLRALLTNHVEPVITKHASAFWKERNYREMCRDPEYIPATCMVELPLHAVAEVRQSEGYTALNARKDATLWDCALALKPYVLSVQDMNRMALKTRAEEAFYRCLHGAATGFIAQRNVERYTPHQAVMDAFASNANDIMNVVKLSLKSVLRGYKKEHSLDRLPTPTTTFDFGQTLGEVNGPSPAANQGASRTGGEDAVAMEEETADTPRGRLANSAAAILRGGGNPYAVTPRVNTNEALASITNNNMPPPAAHHYTIVAGDAEAEAARAEAERAAAASRAQPVGPVNMVVADLVRLVVEGIQPALNAFDNTVKENDELKRIKKATASIQIEKVAERVAETVARDRAVDRPTLQGLIRNETDKGVAELQRQVQSLTAQVESLKKRGSSKGGGRPNDGGAKSSKTSRHGGAGRSGGRPATGGRGNGGRGGGRGNGRNLSGGKSAGNKRANKIGETN